MTCTTCHSLPAREGHTTCEQCHLETLLTGADWSVDITGTREDEETVLSACLLGQFTPAELDLPHAAFSGYRAAIWRSLQHHYGDTQAGVTMGPPVAALEQFMAHTLRVRGEYLAEELHALRMARPFVCDEDVIRAAARLLESVRGRELSVKLARVAIRLQHRVMTVREATEEMRPWCS